MRWLKIIKADDVYVACICEGASERAIIDILLDNDKLVFTREDLLNGELIRTRNVKSFQSKYLNKNFTKKVIIYRIKDVSYEHFNLEKVYQNKVKDSIDIVTMPEIEILIIISENKMKDYNKKKYKPSEFCKGQLGMKEVKSYSFVKEYFSDVDKLLYAIKTYASKHHDYKKGECLYNLIRE